jgi:uncharacterized Fe-S cluster protein YjdI
MGIGAHRVTPQRLLRRPDGGRRRLVPLLGVPPGHGPERLAAKAMRPIPRGRPGRGVARLFCGVPRSGRRAEVQLSMAGAKAGDAAGSVVIPFCPFVIGVHREARGVPAPRTSRASRGVRVVSRKVYIGAEVTVTFDPDICQHATEWVRGLPSVFNASRRPWIDPDKAPVATTIEQVRRCPPGALQIGQARSAF